MNEAQVLQRMVAPGTPRPNSWRGGVIQIHVTRACDKACFGCTQGSNLAGKTGFISLEHFEQACRSLRGYFGVVGVFGGNPALHPQFEALCDILARYIPPEQRGIWCNHPRGKGRVMARTFNSAVSNLNVHLDREAHAEFLRDWPGCHPVGLSQDSRHSPPYVAMRDVVRDEARRWELIAGCEINRHWSAMLCVVRGRLRAFFCEVAGAQAMLHQDDPDWPDTGLPAEPGWWRRPLADFAGQVRWHCHRCGVPLRGYGELAQAPDDRGTEQTSATHAGVYRPKRPGRRVAVVRELLELGTGRLQRFTDYLGNAGR